MLHRGRDAVSKCIGRTVMAAEGEGNA